MAINFPNFHLLFSNFLTLDVQVKKQELELDMEQHTGSK